MDEHNAFDLAKLAIPTEPHQWQPQAVDLSGKPKPQGVRVQLNSGVIIKCDCRYQGVNPVDGDRLFTILAEIDWENYWPTKILVAEMPTDVEFRLRVAGLPDELDAQFCSGITLLADRIIHV
jgi:hypothetical protein